MKHRKTLSTIALSAIGVALIFCSSTATGQDANLLKNADIEAAKNGAPSHWKQGATVEGVTYQWAKYGYKSSRSLKLLKSSARFFPIAGWTQTFPHDGAARKLRVSAYVRTVDARKAVLDVSFGGGADGKQTHEWAAYIGNKDTNADPVTHDWKLYTGTVSVPEGTNQITVSPQIYGSGTVWIDNICAEFVP